MSNGTGIEGAIISFSYSGVALGLNNGTYVDLGEGNYSIQITGVLSGDYVVTIEATKAYHTLQSDSFELTVGETGTILDSLNGTADLVPFGQSYRLVLQYTNSTGSGLDGATVEIIDITPVSGLNPVTSVPEGNGYYSFDLAPTVANAYTIFIKANLTNHVSRYFTFNLLVTETPTVLVPDSSGATIAVDQNYTIQLTYEDDLFNGIENANITIPNLPAERI